MESEQPYGPQSEKVAELLDAFLTPELHNIWSSMQFDALETHTSEIQQEIVKAFRALYDASVSTGRAEAWKCAHEAVCDLGSSRYWSTDQMHAVLALTVADLVGQHFTETQLQLLLSIYEKYWDVVSEVVAQTPTNSPERKIAAEMLSKGATWQEALATTKAALLH